MYLGVDVHGEVRRIAGGVELRHQAHHTIDLDTAGGEEVKRRWDA